MAEQHIDDGIKRGRKSAPPRQCAVTRDTADRTELIRFACAPDGCVTPDLKEKLPGRGVWVGARRHLVEAAAAKGAFKRGFKANVVVPDGLADLVGDLLRRDAIQALSLAIKAGVVVTGFDSVSAMIAKGDADVLLQASDAADDGRQKLSTKHDAVAAAAGRAARTAGVLTIDELALATGRANVVHAGLSRSRATDVFVRAADRLARYATDAPIGRMAGLFDEID
ncbi:MAG: RNA-binding protein [Pseudomonadota bacterium]